MKAVSRAGAKRYYLQQFRKKGVCDEELVNYGFADLPDSAVALGEKLFSVFGTR